MSKVLLINPSYRATYGAAKGTMTNPIYPILGLTTIAGEALRRGHQVQVLDMSHRPYDWRLVRSKILEMTPDVVGITATTPLMNQLRDLSVLCKDIAPGMLVVGGGAHISGLPIESMRQSQLDVAIAGEGDLTFGELCDGRDPKTVPGVYYRGSDGEIHYTGQRPLIGDLDTLAMPAWHLFNPREYRDKVSRILVRNPPATIAEFSRGCVFKCDFCASKMTMAYGYRKKSPARCAEEVALLQRLGWREFMLADDIFTSDNEWATEVAEAIIRSGANLSWTCNNGIRVESANDRLFRTLRRAGCYRVSFGFESGNDAVLKAFGKGGRASLEQGRRAVRMARAAGIDTNGFFLLGLSADTAATMADTIEYARSLELDVMMFGIAIAFPGTKMFNDYYREGLVRSFDWDEYHARSSSPLFSHRHLTNDEIQRFAGQAYRRAIMTNPAFLWRRFVRSLRTGDLFWDLYYGSKLAWLPASHGSVGHDYYARDRWPEWSLGEGAPLQVVGYQSATYTPAKQARVAHV